MSDIQNEDYKEKDLVWVKLKGYPWWPSQISQISSKPITTLGKNTKEKIYTIELIGEKNTLKVSSERLEPFTKNYDKHINTKNTSLLKSIELAKKIYEKNSKKEKENEEQNKNNNDNKDNINNDNTSKFLQKKRNNDRIILDDEQNEEDKDIKINSNEEKNENMISTPKNNIKINININLTTNNQHTINLNSFQTKDAMNQTNPNPNSTIIKQNNKTNMPKFNSFNYSTLPANEKTVNKNSNKKDKIFNTNTDSNNKENKILEDQDEKSIKSFKKEKNSEEKEDDIKLKEKPKNNDNEESEEENENSDCEEDNEELILTNDIINESIQKILNCQVQISNLSSQKTINKELVDLSEKFHQLFSKNQNDNDNYEIYYLSKDLIPILMNLTYNKNTDIMSKSSEILSFLNEKIIKEIFNLSQKDQDDLIESLNNNKAKETSNNNSNKNDINLEEDEFKEGLNIIELINKKSTIKSGISDIHTIYSKRGRPKKISINSELSSDVFSSKINDGFFNMNNNINEKNYYEEFIKILSIKDKTKMESDFKEMIGDFFENTYDKNNSDLDIDTAKVRKNMCIKLYKVLKKIFPDIKKDLIKKMIVYFEYKIRNSNVDKIYSIKIKELIKIIKERLYDNDKAK